MNSLCNFFAKDVKGFVTLVSSVDMDGPVVVSLDTFLALSPSPSNVMTQVAADLVKSYACFKEDIVRHHKGNSYTKKHTSAVEKPRIGMRELSREAIARKEFLALINKLSPQNASNIITQCKTSIRPEFLPMYVDMLWNAMMQSPDFQNLYIDVFTAIDSLYSVTVDIRRIWDTYLENKAWLPKPTEEGHSYDDFCDQVKAKKRAIASVKGWVYLYMNKLCKDDVMHVLFREMVNMDAPTDAVIDELIECYKLNARYMRTIDCVREVVHKWHQEAQMLPPMIRFKLYDLWELMEKMKHKV